MNFLAPLFFKYNFGLDKIPLLKEKVCIVTGGNTGIGKVACREYAKNGAHVIMGCRSLQRGQDAVNDIKQSVPDANIEVMELDLSNLQSVSRCRTLFHDI
jgi:NAD(P)-dependent dehydrogenase (short-subunit alcohol dehydrogenase family)